MLYRIYIYDLDVYETYKHAEDYVNRLLEFKDCGHSLCFTIVDKSGLFTHVEFRRVIKESEENVNV